MKTRSPLGIRQLLIAQLIIASLVAASCSTQNAADSDLPQLTAEPATIIDRFDGYVAGLAPAGDVAFMEVENDESEWRSLCLIEIGTGAQRFCIDSPVDLWVRQHDWAPQGDVAVFHTITSGGIVLVDLATGKIDNLTADTGDDAVDRRPAFSPTGNRIAFYRRTAEGNSIQLYDRSERRIVAAYQFATTEPFFAISYPPLMIDESRALLGAPNHVFEVDMVSGEVTQLLDYSQSFRPAFPVGSGLGFQLGVTLHPVAFLNDGRLLLYDDGVVTAFSQTGALSGGYSSGYLLADLDDGSLVPLFEDSPNAAGWYGPMIVMQAGRDQLVVSWLDASERDADGLRAITRLSLLDLAVEDLPVHPREIPEVWSGDTGVAVAGTLPGRAAKIGPDATIAIVTADEEGTRNTALLQLAHE